MKSGDATKAWILSQASNSIYDKRARTGAPTQHVMTGSKIDKCVFKRLSPSEHVADVIDKPGKVGYENSLACAKFGAHSFDRLVAAD